MTAAPRRGVALALLLAFAVAWFANLDHRHLIKADEGRYAEIAREMVASGDWLTPRLNDFKYFEKPPLQYWATAAAFTVFGIDEWSARLWTALTGFLTVIATFLAGNVLFGRPAGLYGAAVTASAALFAGLGHFSSLDMGVAAFLSLGALAFCLALRDGATVAERRWWMIAAWACAAMATLSKGLIGIVLPAGAIGAYVLLQRDWRLPARLHVLPGLAVFIVIAVPWFVLVSRANPEFFHFFFIHEHYERFTSRVHGRYEPMWYFLPILAGGLMPWTLTLVPAAAHAWTGDDAARFRPGRFLLVWVVVVFAFFSVSSSKLPSYVLPIFPALGLLIGATLAAGRGARIFLVQAVVVTMVGIALAFYAPGRVMRDVKPDLPAELLAAYVPWLVAAALALAAGGAIAALAAWRGRRTIAVVALAGGGLAFAQLALTGHESLAPAYSAYHGVAQIRPRPAEDVPFFSVNTFDHSVPFYLGRPVTMVAYRDELAMPIEWEPQKFLPDYAAFERAWAEAPAAYAVFHPRDFAEFERRGLPMTVIARDPRRVFVKKQ